MSFATGIQLGPACFTGTFFENAPVNTPQTPFFGTGGAFKRKGNDSEVAVDFDVSTPSAKMARNGVINTQGAKAVYIQPLMQDNIFQDGRVTASGVQADSDITATASRMGFEVYGMKTIGDPQTPNEDNFVFLWNIGFIQSMSWVDSTFAVPDAGSSIVHPDDGKTYNTYATAGVSDVTVIDVEKTRPHYVAPAMSGASAVLPDITDGTDTDFTNTADSSFCIVPLNPFFDHLVLSLCTSNNSGPKLNGVNATYRFALIY